VCTCNHYRCADSEKWQNGPLKNSQFCAHEIVSLSLFPCQISIDLYRSWSVCTCNDYEHADSIKQWSQVPKSGLNWTLYILSLSLFLGHVSKDIYISWSVCTCSHYRRADCKEVKSGMQIWPELHIRHLIIIIISWSDIFISMQIMISVHTQWL
jgi:hypothetical protein